MLTSYSDEQVRVGVVRARAVRAHARRRSKSSGSPTTRPSASASWVTSVGAAEVRALDLRLLLDLLTHRRRSRAMEGRDGPGREPYRRSAARRRLQRRDLQLTNLLTHEADGEGNRKPAAAAALARLVEGAMMTHIVSHLRSVDESARRAAATAVLHGGSVDHQAGSPRRSPSRNARPRGSGSRRFCWDSAQPDRPPSNSCARRRTRPCAARRSICSASSAARRRSPT